MINILSIKNIPINKTSKLKGKDKNDNNQEFK
jgi:hypothetical protein